MKRITELDESKFSSINDEETAYFLGLIYSDGNIHKSPIWESYTISITQSEKDKDIVEKFKNFLHTGKKIAESEIKGSKYYTLTVNSKEIYKNLYQNGVKEKKSLIIEFPTYIENSLMRHFIRGYFDGDGCIWNGKRKKMLVKNERKKGELRERIVHNVKFTFTGSSTFIPYLQDYLIKNIGLSKNKLNYSKAKEDHRHCIMEYSGRKNILKLYDFMYKDATIFGERKKKKFEEILTFNNENNSDK